MSFEALKAELKSTDQPINGPRRVLLERLVAAVNATSATPVFRGRQLNKESTRRLRDVGGDFRTGL